MSNISSESDNLLPSSAFGDASDSTLNAPAGRISNYISIDIHNETFDSDETYDSLYRDPDEEAGPYKSKFSDPIIPKHYYNDPASSPRKPLSNETKELIAEFVGTFLLMQIGGGTNCAALYYSAQVGVWQVAIAWGAALAVIIATLGPISGAHLNPAMSFSMALFRDLEWRKFRHYTLMQCGGALLANLVNYALFKDEIYLFELKNKIVRGELMGVRSAKGAFADYWSTSSWATALLAEVLGTFLMAFFVFALTHPKNTPMIKSGGVAIPMLTGGMLASLISSLGPVSGAGMNPARDFPPRIVTWLFGWGSQVSFKGCWVYVVGPMIGAPLGAFMVERVFYE